MVRKQNQIRPGYRLTEVGIIPVDWEAKTIGEILDFKNWLNKEKEAFWRGTPIVNYMDVYRNRGLTASAVKWKVTLTGDELRNYEARKWDVFFTRTSETVDEVWISSVLLEGIPKATFSGFILRGRPKNDQIDLQYAKYCFGTKSVRNGIISSSTYTTRALTNGRSLSRIKILVPKKTEQAAIANALSDIENLIQSLDSLIEKKRAIKQGAVQGLITGCCRLPGFVNEWQIKKLWDVWKCLRGVSYDPDKDLHSFDTIKTARLLRSNNVRNSKINIEDVQYVDLQRVKAEQLIEHDDILICMANGSKDLVWKAGQFNLKDVSKYTFGAFMGCFRTDQQKADASFIFHFFQTNFYRVCINNLLAWSSINNIRPSNIESITLSLPDRLEQSAISKVLSDMDAEITDLELKRDKYQDIKQGMMHELLTGSIRLLWAQ